MITDYDAEIAKAQAEIDRLTKERDYLKSLGPDKELAVQLHSMKCFSNHIDVCGWDYEIHKGVHDWNQYTHKRYLDKAHRVMASLPDKSVDDILEIARVL